MVCLLQRVNVEVPSVWEKINTFRARLLLLISSILGTICPVGKLSLRHLSTSKDDNAHNKFHENTHSHSQEIRCIQTAMTRHHSR
jgi:hypothetical protein